MKLSSKEKDILKISSGDIPLSHMPFNEMAREIGVREDRFLAKLKEFKKKNVIRKFGAVLNHRSCGFKGGILAAWKVPKNKIDKFKSMIRPVQEISHCYKRKTYPFWRFNIYTMINGKSKKKYFCNHERLIIIHLSI